MTDSTSSTSDPRKACLDTCVRKKEYLNSPKLPGIGPSDARIMFVGEAPGQDEDKRGEPFIGASGKLLSTVFSDVGLRREDVYITNSVKCATADQNQKPSKREITLCRSYLIKEIKNLKPNVICVLGATALESVLKRTGLSKLKNTVLWSSEFNVKVIPVWHPAYILRNPAAYDDLLKGLSLVVEESKSKKAVEREKLPTKHVDAATPKQIDKVLDALEASDTFVFDLETTSLDVRASKIITIALSWKTGVGVTIKWDRLSETQMKRLRALLASPRHVKCGHHVTYDIEVLMKNGVQVVPPVFDTLTAISLLNENLKDKGLDALTLQCLDLGEYWAPLDEFKKQYIKENKIEKSKFSYDLIPYPMLAEYAQCDADATFRLMRKFKKELNEVGLMSFYEKYTLPTMWNIMRMEYKGIAVDRDKLNHIAKSYVERIAQAYDTIAHNDTVVKYNKIMKKREARELEEHWDTSKTLRGRYPDVAEYIKIRRKKDSGVFNPSSTKQLREILYDILKLRAIKITDTKQNSTDEETLSIFAKDFDVPLAKDIVAYRRLVKFKSTYIDSIYAKSELDGRIHPSYLQHRTVTGRLSSNNPNFQNIPRDAKDFKSCFLADKGMIFVKGDLAQAEFRCWAHYANDENMIKDIEAGLDIHRRTASEVFGVPPEEITKEQRTIAKSTVFGLMYGRGTNAIAKQFGMDKAQAADIKDVFFDRYPIAASWLDDIVRYAKLHKQVVTWMGRIRRLPEIDSQDDKARSEAERQAKNSPIQGLASDMNNHFMVRTLKLAKKNEIKCYPAATIHDANVLQVEPHNVTKLVKLMKHVVKTSFPGFLCEMKLDFEVGKTLGTMEELSEWLEKNKKK